jgi:hypothetical protein
MSLFNSNEEYKIKQLTSQLADMAKKTDDKVTLSQYGGNLTNAINSGKKVIVDMTPTVVPNGISVTDLYLEGSDPNNLITVTNLYGITVLRNLVVKNLKLTYNTTRSYQEYDALNSTTGLSGNNINIQAAPNTTFFYFNDAYTDSKFVLENLEVEYAFNFVYSFVARTGSVKNLTVRNNRFTKCYGFNVKVPCTINGGIVENNYVADMNSDTTKKVAYNCNFLTLGSFAVDGQGVRTDYRATGIIVRNNTMKNCLSGGYSGEAHFALLYGDNCIVEDNHLENLNYVQFNTTGNEGTYVEAEPIYFYISKDSVAQRNTFINCMIGEAYILSKSGYNIAIRDNTITDNTNGIDNIDHNIIRLITMQGGFVSIEGNTIVSNNTKRSHCLYLSSGTGFKTVMKIKNNQINSYGNIRFISGLIDMQGNSIVINGKSLMGLGGTAVADASGTILHNEITAKSIVTLDTASGSVIDLNVVSNKITTSLLMEGSPNISSNIRLSVRSNEITVKDTYIFSNTLGNQFTLELLSNTITFTDDVTQCKLISLTADNTNTTTRVISVKNNELIYNNVEVRLMLIAGGYYSRVDFSDNDLKQTSTAGVGKAFRIIHISTASTFGTLSTQNNNLLKVLSGVTMYFSATSTIDKYVLLNNAVLSSPLTYSTFTNAVITNRVYESGATTERPNMVVIGTRFFDTTLNKPIWVKSISPITWVDSAGTTV